ncbi:MAG: cobalt ECF transporter T component CbiQ [Acidimicrobiia bacterium]
MSGGHAHPLHLHGHSPVHALAAETKLAAMLAFVLAVVATPREAVWAFAMHAALVIVVLHTAEIPLGFYLRRVAVVLPFLGFALFLPWLGGGSRIELLGMSLSAEGLWGAWTIVAKGVLGVSASIVMAATTEVPHILTGLDRLRVPRLVTAIAGFMIRYLDVVADESQRMRVAMVSRGYDPRWLWQAKALGISAGALFIRSYERGERVYYAMAARGYRGHMPAVEGGRAGPADWVTALTVPTAAWLVALLALVGP